MAEEAEEQRAREPERDEPGAEGAEARRVQATKLTDRDKDMLGLLVVTRYLTAQQVHRLAFDGRNISAAYRRLLKLSRSDGGQVPFVRQRFFRTYDGNRVAVWAPTPHALLAASVRAGGLPELPRHDVGAQFLEHLIQLNELFIALWRTGDGRCARVAHPSFRWVPSDCVRLSWGEYEMREGRRQLRVIQPDAVLELPAQRRRLFLECEMGSHTISPGPAKPPGATLSKADRYQDYLGGLAELMSNRTHYQVQHPDGFAPEVIFLVRTEGRANSINAALAKWRPEQGPRLAALRALTFEAAAVELRRLAGLPGPAGNPSPRGGYRPEQPVTRAITLEEVFLLRRYVSESVAAIKRARAVFRELRRADLPEYPRSHDDMAALVEKLLPWVR
jgi:hypothetical protein